MTDAHEVTRKLVEDLWYPAHEPRKASSTYRHTHKLLIRDRNEPCWICGITYRDWQKLPKAVQHVWQIESHHSRYEWATQNGLDVKQVESEYPEVTDEAALRHWIDSPSNMLILCASHHRGASGIHSITEPIWALQRNQLLGDGAFTFIPQDTWQKHMPAGWTPAPQSAPSQSESSLLTPAPQNQG